MLSSRFFNRVSVVFTITRFFNDAMILKEVAFVIWIYLEAEYAFQLRKSIVPLMVEKNYQPDGWLGFVVGAKYWIDFTTRLQFKDDTNKLIREIGDRGKVDSEMIIPVDDVDLGGKTYFIIYCQETMKEQEIC